MSFVKWPPHIVCGSFELLHNRISHTIFFLPVKAILFSSCQPMSALRSIILFPEQYPMSSLCPSVHRASPLGPSSPTQGCRVRDWYVCHPFQRQRLLPNAMGEKGKRTSFSDVLRAYGTLWECVGAHSQATGRRGYRARADTVNAMINRARVRRLPDNRALMDCLLAHATAAHRVFL